jgi:hypothetical protein
MKDGKGVYIENMMEAPKDWASVHEPVFSDVMMKPELARLIDKLISTNKITQQPFLNAWRNLNRIIGMIKLFGSIFHLRNIAQGALADTNFLGFASPKVWKQIMTFGFKENDPEFTTPRYLKFVERGGSHRFSAEADAQQLFKNIIVGLQERLGKAGIVLWPARFPMEFTEWMFNQYIPKVAYQKYLQEIEKIQQTKGREETDWEGINIIKETQNILGEMNERLFGRSGTEITGLRFVFMMPGFAEGNFRVILKGMFQGGQNEGWSAGRSRVNVPNALLVSLIISTIGTLILTRKPPKMPETVNDIPDLWKIDTGITDKRDRRVMIDMMAFEKDYWSVYFNLARGRPDIMAKEVIKRLGGMKAPIFDMATDLAKVSLGEAIVDWKGDRITEITDPWLQKLMKIAIHELKNIEPISVSVYNQAREKECGRIISFVEAISGVRPTKTEADKKDDEENRRIWSLRDQKDGLYLYLSTADNPRKMVDKYNARVREILESPLMPVEKREEWEENLLVDIDQLIKNKTKDYHSPANTADEADRMRKFLVNLDETPEGVWEGPESLREAMSRFTMIRRTLQRKEDNETITNEEKYQLKKARVIETNIVKIAKRLSETDNEDNSNYYEDIEQILNQFEQE